MNGTPLLLAIVGHLVGDYLLQNDWMALNKKRKGWDGFVPCSFHAFFWTLAVCLFSGWWNLEVWGFLFFAHFFQDRTKVVGWWMQKIGQRQFMKPDEFCWGDSLNHDPHVRVGLGPWSVIVVDNVWHIVSLWVVWRFIA